MAPELDVDLVAALRAVQEATSLRGPRFLPQTAKALERMVLSRAFGKPMLELAYLVAIAAACRRPTGRYEAFFWNDQPAIGGVFRAYLSRLRERGQLAGSGLTLGTDRVAIATDGEPFAVHYTRMPLLVALAEFLMSTIGYPTFDAAVQPVAVGTLRQRDASDVANTLSRALHGYLQGRLETGHIQRKMSAMLEHLAARGRGDAASIDDGAILSFWIAKSGTDELEGVRTFRGTATGFIHLRDALTAAQNRAQLDQARPIGTDREAGEVDPGAVAAALAELGEESDLISALTSAPLASVKFCNQRELGQLDVVVLYGRHGPGLIRTALRYDVFGGAQARITQALRRGYSWRQDPDGTYVTRVAELRRLHEQFDRVLWASLHVLIEKESPAVIDLLHALQPDLDLSGALPPSEPDSGTENVVQLRQISPAQRFLHLLRFEPAALGSRFAQVAATASLAFGKIARKGFGGDDLADAAVIDAFQAAPPVLRQLRALLARFTRQLEAKADQELERLFADDRAVFYDQFEQLYGEA
ncbi:MAG: hypothetical protein R3F55_09370 [Alphaproteobacteria bacterium]